MTREPGSAPARSHQQMERRGGIDNDHHLRIQEACQAREEDMGGVVLSAEDVPNTLRFAYLPPQNVCIREFVLAATRQQA